jgi:hypothetical protein
MKMNPDPTTDVTRFEDYLLTDPVIVALQKERVAFQAYSVSLEGLAQIGAFSSDVPPEGLISMQLAQLPGLEAAEAKASMALVEAEQDLLATKLVSIRGAVALIGFLGEHLNEDTDINPVREALGNIQAFLIRSSSRCQEDAGQALQS